MQLRARPALIWRTPICSTSMRPRPGPKEESGHLRLGNFFFTEADGMPPTDRIRHGTDSWQKTPLRISPAWISIVVQTLANNLILDLLPTRNLASARISIVMMRRLAKAQRLFHLDCQNSAMIHTAWITHGLISVLSPGWIPPSPRASCQ